MLKKQYIHILIPIILALNVFDIEMTLYGIYHGYAEEYNQIILVILDKIGWMGVAITKIVFCLSLYLVFVADHWKKLWVQVLLLFIVAKYLTLALYHVMGFLFFS